jgi:2'-5' RNA ligase
MNMGSSAGSGSGSGPAGPPEQMTDRWRDRPEPGPGDARLVWHVLMRDQPQARALAAVARQRLAGCGAGLHFTPEPWLHLSVLRLGLASELAQPALEAMVDQARSRLAAVPPAQVTLGRVLYHPEAVALRADPADGLAAITGAVRAAASTLGRAGSEPAEPGIPHVTVAYSTQDQPAGPVVAALGHELPQCPVTIDAVYLVAQRGAERDWAWQVMAGVPLGGSPG